jgi:hypothetical protein
VGGTYDSFRANKRFAKRYLFCNEILEEIVAIQVGPEYPKKYRFFNRTIAGQGFQTIGIKESGAAMVAIRVPNIPL